MLCDGFDRYTEGCECCVTEYDRYTEGCECCVTDMTSIQRAVSVVCRV